MDGATKMSREGAQGMCSAVTGRQVTEMLRGVGGEHWRGATGMVVTKMSRGAGEDHRGVDVRVAKSSDRIRVCT